MIDPFVAGVFVGGLVVSVVTWVIEILIDRHFGRGL